MDLAEALRPMSLADFRERFFGKKPFAIARKENPFTKLLSLDEIETRLNDGSASLVDLAVIDGSGHKLPRGEIYVRQPAGGWCPFFLDKSKVRGLLEQGSSFVMHNMSQVNPRVAALLASIEHEFPGYHADLHVYVSPRPQATAYNVHRDQPQHKLYIQLIGSTNWTLYKGRHQATAMSVADAAKVLKVDFELELTPGSVLYMPPGTYHRATNDRGPRVSLSMPFSPNEATKLVDRSFVPLKSFFESESVTPATEREALEELETTLGPVPGAELERSRREWPKR